MFHEVEFPRGISYGSRGGPRFDTQILETDGGHEHRISRLSAPRHEFEVNYGVKRLDDLTTLRTFFIARRGAFFGFRYWDPLDYTTSANHRSTPSHLNQLIGSGNGVQTDFQLTKAYTDDAGSWTRVIEKPIEGTVKVGLATVNQTSGWTVDVTTGVITFSSPPGVGVAVTAGCEFNVPVRFSKETDNSFTLAVDAFDSGSVPVLKVVEIRSEASVGDAPYMGGSKVWAIQNDITVSQGLGRVNLVEALNTGRKVYLPDPTMLPPGGPYFLIYNAGATNSFNVYSGATNFGALAPGESFEVYLGVDGADTNFWIVR